MILLFLLALIHRAPALGIDVNLTLASLQIEGSIDISLGLPDFLTESALPIIDTDPEPYNYVHPLEFSGTDLHVLMERNGGSASSLDQNRDEGRGLGGWGSGPALWKAPQPNQDNAGSPPTHSDKNPVNSPSTTSEKSPVNSPSADSTSGTDNDIESEVHHPDGNYIEKRFHQPNPKLYDDFADCCHKGRDLESRQPSPDDDFSQPRLWFNNPGEAPNPNRPVVSSDNTVSYTRPHMPKLPSTLTLPPPPRRTLGVSQRDKDEELGGEDTASAEVMNTDPEVSDNVDGADAVDLDGNSEPQPPPQKRATVRRAKGADDIEGRGPGIDHDLRIIQAEVRNQGKTNPAVGSPHTNQQSPSYSPPGRRRPIFGLFSDQEAGGFEVVVPLLLGSAEVEVDEDREVELEIAKISLELVSGEEDEDEGEEESEAIAAEERPDTSNLMGFGSSTTTSENVERDPRSNEENEAGGSYENRSANDRSAGCNPGEMRCTPHGTCLSKTAKCCKGGKTYCPESFYCINNGQSCCRVGRWCPINMWGNMKRNSRGDNAVEARDSRHDDWALSIAMDFHL
ncbi:hypothetical protein CcaverHIS002_0203310 [Cutaneotrichosporon cavernicola]|uniref:Granulins domain-containing protein n=1 Tax=Cutaneotrichosporon cavernicola TaxID=279322 RepID=A0AA48IID9_9TREE|nr:uncharacterized protein CcaverHIS019_0203300 [Cutaneotrichosporon cavernicola]BEI81171.1 hypothetical protein CcaverHIS002_0203310 [Cutaneotrichosporon cavernicola]BEI88968.1 hypothetical protein CcaverHIS019_0203300 [Cutaneotrichosporon cavernicola]BEI96745.1 hypothetical protein CcaverHIS631_0203340 [Cutaneotrichosporon cavernicola]BEJ04517.1 hypothetical protein CcaverHIS641_0203340 [Cutaneotrichosporon cavernicola]